MLPAAHSYKTHRKLPMFLPIRIGNRSVQIPTNTVVNLGVSSRRRSTDGDALRTQGRTDALIVIHFDKNHTQAGASVVPGVKLGPQLVMLARYILS